MNKDIIEICFRKNGKIGIKLMYLKKRKDGAILVKYKYVNTLGYIKSSEIIKNIENLGFHIPSTALIQQINSNPITFKLDEIPYDKYLDEVDIKVKQFLREQKLNQLL